jgi:hypothetical protein
VPALRAPQDDPLLLHPVSTLIVCFTRCACTTRHRFALVLVLCFFAKREPFFKLRRPLDCSLSLHTVLKYIRSFVTVHLLLLQEPEPRGRGGRAGPRVQVRHPALRDLHLSYETCPTIPSSRPALGTAVQRSRTQRVQRRVLSGGNYAAACQLAFAFTAAAWDVRGFTGACCVVTGQSKCGRVTSSDVIYARAVSKAPQPQAETSRAYCPLLTAHSPSIAHNTKTAVNKQLKAETERSPSLRCYSRLCSRPLRPRLCCAPAARSCAPGCAPPPSRCRRRWTVCGPGGRSLVRARSCAPARRASRDPPEMKVGLREY